MAPLLAAPAPDSGFSGSTEASLLSETERFVMELSAEEAAAAAAAPPPTAQPRELQAQLAVLQGQVGLQLASFVHCRLALQSDRGARSSALTRRPCCRVPTTNLFGCPAGPACPRAHAGC